MKKFNDATLILNPDGTIYHLNIFPEQIAETIILVGDPNRVAVVAKYFDQIEVERSNREFTICTGTIGKKHLSVVSTGIGTGSIDIVINELDALVNIDFATRTVKPEIKRLQIIRMGTCGALQKDIPLDSLVVTNFVLSFDGLLHFYQNNLTELESSLLKSIKKHFSAFPVLSSAYVAQASSLLNERLASMSYSGITLTCPGFYGPQSRELRLALPQLNLLQAANQFVWQDQQIVNFEMETAAILALGRYFGHECASISTVVGQRIHGTFSQNPYKAVEEMIVKVLEKITS